MFSLQAFTQIWGLDQAQRQVDDGYQSFIDGDYARALASTRAALAFYDAAPGQLARESGLRDLRYRALVIAARSAEVKGTAQEAFGFMAELIRSFPDRPVTSAQYDPSVNGLYSRVKAELARQGMGSLEVKIDDPGVTAFVDEQFGGSGGLKLTGIPPGRWRVFVAKGQESGRVHEVEVPPKGTATLTISWSIDGALHTSSTAAALDYDKTAGTDLEIQGATEIARDLGASNVIMLSVRPINGRRAIAAYSISVESQTRAFAGVQTEPIEPSAETFAQLAALLAGDKVDAPGLITTEPTSSPALGHEGPGLALVGASTDEPSWYQDRLGWVVTVAGALALGGGVYAEARASSLDDEASRDTSQTDRQQLQDDASSNRKVGEVLLVAGGVVLAAGIVRLVLVPSRSRSTVTSRAPKTSLDVGPVWVGMSVRF